MDITYTLSLTVTRPVRLWNHDDTLTENADWMQSAEAQRQLEKEVLKALTRLDGDCDCEVLETARETTQAEDAAAQPDDEPCLPDGTPLYPQRKATRQERLQAQADAGDDTLDWSER